MRIWNYMKSLFGSPKMSEPLPIVNGMDDDITCEFIVVWNRAKIVSRVQFNSVRDAIDFASSLDVSAQVLETETYKIVYANIHSPIFRGN